MADSLTPDHGSMQAAEQKMREALAQMSRRDAPAERASDTPRAAMTTPPARPSTPRPTQGRPSNDRPSPNGHRHRFVQDGEVPVVMVSNGGGLSRAPAENRTPSSRPATTVDVAAERSARERAERALRDAQNMIRDLETKLAHAELARTEAVNQAKASRAAAVAAREEASAQIARAKTLLEEERGGRERAEARLQAALEGRTEEPRVKRKYTRRKPLLPVTPEPWSGEAPAPEVAVGAEVGVPRLRKRAAGLPKAPRERMVEPKPVKWWIKKAAR